MSPARAALAIGLAIGLATGLRADDPPRPFARIDIDAALGQDDDAPPPSPVVDDAAFLRRVRLDVDGALPTSSELALFLADPAPDKRERLIAQLVRGPGYARRLARELELELIEGLAKDGLEGLYREGFRAWLEAQLRADRPWGALVADLLAAEGRSDRDPAVLYVLDHARAGAPEDVAGPALRHFLALDVECARCHDHPFAPWTQDDFHGVAAFFARARARPEEGAAGVFRLTEGPTGEHRFTGADARRREVAPRPLTTPTEQPRPGHTPDAVTRTSRRATFARWLTSPDNPWFGRAVVHRVWARLFGRPLVEPDVDDARRRALRDRLAVELMETGGSLQALHAALLRTRAYQRSSAREDGRFAEARARFATAAVRPLAADVVADALLRALGRDEPGFLQERLRAALLAELTQALPDRAQADPDAVTTAQALVLLNGERTTTLVRAAAAKLVASTPTPAARVDALWRRTLSRDPRPAEREAALGALSGPEPAATEDLLWALVASSEFLTNH